MKGCLVSLLAVCGILLLLPGLCYKAVGTLAGPNNPADAIFAIAIAMIVVAIALGVLWKGE